MVQNKLESDLNLYGTCHLLGDLKAICFILFYKQKQSKTKQPQNKQRNKKQQQQNQTKAVSGRRCGFKGVAVCKW